MPSASSALEPAGSGPARGRPASPAPSTSSRCPRCDRRARYRPSAPGGGGEIIPGFGRRCDLGVAVGGRLGLVRVQPGREVLPFLGRLRGLGLSIGRHLDAVRAPPLDEVFLHLRRLGGFRVAACAVVVQAGRAEGLLDAISAGPAGKLIGPCSLRQHRGHRREQNMHADCHPSQTPARLSIAKAKLRISRGSLFLLELPARKVQQMIISSALVRVRPGFSMAWMMTLKFSAASGSSGRMSGMGALDASRKAFLRSAASSPGSAPSRS